MAGPLHAVNGMLADIRSGRFDPDSTRSGRWSTADELPAESDEPVDGGASDQSSDSDDESASEDEDALQAEGFRAIVELTPPPLQPDVFETLVTETVVYNKKTMRRHIAVPDVVGRRLVCGTAMTNMVAGGSPGMPVCDRCLNHVKKKGRQAEDPAGAAGFENAML